MDSRPQSPSNGQPRLNIHRLIIVGVCLLLLIAAVGPFANLSSATPPTSSLTADPGSAETTVSDPAAQPTENGTEVGRVTLITGEEIIISEQEGQRAYHASDGTPIHVISTTQGTYVYPTGTDFNRFEPDIFNVDRILQEYGEDGTVTQIPVIVTEAVAQESDRRGPTGDLFREATTTPGFSVHTELESLNGVAGTIGGPERALAYDQFNRSPAVGKVYYDAKVSVTLDDANRIISAVESRSDYEVDGSGIEVAVLDTGVDTTHPDLDGRIAYEEALASPTTEDINGHGTHVAGIVAGDGTMSNGETVGIAPNATIYNIKVLGNSGTGSRSVVVDGIERATELGVDVISMSLGGPPTTDNPYIPAVNAATANGTLVVISAGNSGPSSFTIGTPGDIESALTVAATDDGDQITDWSSRGPTDFTEQLKPNIAAPGFAIQSLQGRGEAVTTGYTKKSGTSMSAPMVSGSAALVLEDRPDLTVPQLKSVLVTTADPLSYDGYTVGTGRLNVSAALRADVLFDQSTLNYGILTDTETVTRTVTVTNTGPDTETFTINAQSQNLDGDTGAVTPEVPSVTLQPGETTTVDVNVDADTEAGYYSGHIVFDGDDQDYRIALGYRSEQGASITVTKTARDETSINGDGVILFNHDEQRDNIQFFSQDTEQDQLTFRVFEGRNYTVLSGGYDENTGEGILLGEPLGVVDGPVSVSLDEREAIPLTVDTTGLDHADLTYLKKAAQVWFTLPDDPYARAGQYPTYRVQNSDTTDSTLYVGPTGIEVGYAALAVPTAQYDGRNSLDVADTYVLGESMTVEPWRNSITYRPSSDISTHELTYHKLNDDDTYTMERGMRYSTDIISLEFDFGSFTLGDRQTQTVHLDAETSNDNNIRAPFTLREDSGAHAYSYIDYLATDPGETLVAGTNKPPLIGQQNFRIDPSRNALYAGSYRLYGQGPAGHPLVPGPSSTVTLDATIAEDGVEQHRVQNIATDGMSPSISANQYDFTFTPDSQYTLELVQQFNGVELGQTTKTVLGVTNTGTAQSAPQAENVDLRELTADGYIPVGNSQLTFEMDTAQSDCSACTATVYIAPNTVSTPLGENGWVAVPVEPGTTDRDYIATLDTTGLSTETGHLGIRIDDGDGGFGEYTFSHAFRLNQSPPSDTTPPTAALTASPTTVAPGETVTLDATASTDNVGITEYHWDFDGDGSVDQTTTDATTSTTYTTDDEYQPSVTVVDAAGNSATTTTQLTVVTPDPLAVSFDDQYIPSVTATDTVTLYGQATNVDSSATLTFSGPSGEKTVTVSGDTYFSEDLTLLAGENRISVTVTGSAGETATDTVTVVSDATAPTITETTLTPYVEVLPGSLMTASVSATDAESTVTSVRVNGIELTQNTDGTWSDSVTAASTTGIHSATVAVEDAAGNTSYETVLYLVGTPVRE
jgi:subtilisin family serine protease